MAVRKVTQALFGKDMFTGKDFNRKGKKYHNRGGTGSSSSSSGGASTGSSSGSISASSSGSYGGGSGGIIGGSTAGGNVGGDNNTEGVSLTFIAIMGVAFFVGIIALIGGTMWFLYSLRKEKMAD